MIRRLARSIRQYKLASILAPLFIMGECAMEVLIPTLMANLIDYGVELGDMHYVLLTAGKLLLCAAVALRLCEPVGRLGSLRLAAIALRLPLQPVLGVGLAHQEAVQSGDVHAHLLGAAHALEPSQRLVAFIGLVEGLVQRALLQLDALRLRAGAQVGLRARLFKVAGDQLQAEGVDGGNRRQLHAPGLLLHAHVALGLGLQPRGQALAQLVGRGAREGDDEEGRDVRAPGDQLKDPLDQHRGLARARRRADQQIALPVRDHALLIQRKLRHRAPPFPSPAPRR